jgi:F-type H+-transporting ATPase subunit c
MEPTTAPAAVDSSIAAAKFIGAGLMAGGMLGAAIGVGLVFAGLLNGMARNPAMEGKLKALAFVGAGLSEAMGLFALVIAFMMLLVL